MEYIKVKWVHAFAHEPVLLYSELDADRREVRKVEVFADGRMEFADANKTSGRTMLGEAPIPPLAQIAADPQFEPCGISVTEFEAVWRKARAK